MTGSWVSFIHHLEPNPLNVKDISLSWPDYRVAAENMVFVADGSYIEEDVYRSEGLKLWTEQRILGCNGLRAN